MSTEAAVLSHFDGALDYLWSEWRRQNGDIHPQLYRPAPGFEALFNRMMSWQAPMPKREVRDAYDKIAKDEDFLAMRDPARPAMKIAFLADLIEATDARRVVDAGCGSGRDLIYLARAFPDAAFFGYDLSPKSVELAEERKRFHKLDNVTLFVSDHAELTIERLGGAVDLVFTKGSLGAGDAAPVPPRTLKSANRLKQFMRKEPGLRRQQSLLSAIAKVILPGGTYVNICRSDEDQLRIIVEQARPLGLVHDGNIGTFPGAPFGTFTELERFAKR